MEFKQSVWKRIIRDATGIGAEFLMMLALVGLVVSMGVGVYRVFELVDGGIAPPCVTVFTGERR